MTVLFTAWGYEVTLLELAAVVAAVVAIALGIVGTRWTWPLYGLSGVLYAWLFLEFDLLASALLQLVFIGAAVWGWFTWGAEGVRSPAVLTPRQRGLLIVGAAAAWVVAAPMLQAVGGAATWPDSFILVGSLVAQVLMVLEHLEAWPAWIVVNVVAVVHYANQGLWFTALLYLVLIGMAVVGWRAWSTRRTAVLAGAQPVAA
jgi:nicotinamide mononucleotide transporter